MLRYTALAAAFVLAGCELDMAGPQSVERPPERPGTEALRSQCTTAAHNQNLGVLRVGDFRTVTGSQGLEIGSTATMTVVRDSQVFDMRCSYSFGDQEIRLTEV